MTTFKDKFPYAYSNHLSVLSDEDKKIVVNYYGLGAGGRLSLEEIAELIRKPGLSTTAVRGRLTRAIGKLREAHEAHEAKELHSSR